MLIKVITTIQIILGTIALVLCASDSETVELGYFMAVKLMAIVCVIACVGLEHLKDTVRWAIYGKHRFKKAYIKKGPIHNGHAFKNNPYQRKQELNYGRP